MSNIESGTNISVSEETDHTSGNKSMLSPNINSCDIDRMVELEAQRIRQNFMRGEQQYIEEMFLDNPIAIERRPSVNQYQPQYQEQQQRRGNVCRRSRYNNKVMKAKLKYRHQFISKKLAQTSDMFERVLDFVAVAEQQVLRQGMSLDKLGQIRDNCRVDRTLNDVVQLYTTMPIEF